jgi:hypothetical protein
MRAKKPRRGTTLDPTMDPTGQVAKRFSLADPDDQDHAREHGEGTYTG